jgi:hypothetical protein
MTLIKVDGKPSTQAGEALTPHASKLSARLGSSRLAIVELRSVENVVPGPDEDRETTVKVRIVMLEVAAEEQEETLRKALHALHVHRTAWGTLTEDGDLEFAKDTLASLRDDLHGYEAARLRSLIDLWTGYARNALLSRKITQAELRSELQKTVDALREAIHGGRENTD